ncbi:AraC family transcriptional regulator [Dyadobacter sp. CY326]|uniref:helix-turn-helix domain-containing protein n=1 Tax=Dyadobacter sp. CY326 TaxID=2907300 RepID=UPI001F24D7CF|nr:helix-turn-helix domain-containing protein [Dyadobacter sp. CY326]MCE7065062.1 AraC family transcriptional regulator [Dyadobacter sp. CY326]
MNMTSESLYDLYKMMNLPLDAVDPSSGFTIHALSETFTVLPFQSITYRPDYFSFVFVKEARGKYVIDEMDFPIEPGTIYFTNPGNVRQFEWYSIEDAFLITFKEAFLKEHVHHDVFNDFSFLLTEIVQPKILEQSEFDEIEALYCQIYKEQTGHSPYKNKIIGSLFVVLLLKIKEFFWQDYNPIYEGNRSSSIVKIFKQNLENSFRDLLNGRSDKAPRVQDLAALQSLHPNYLSSVIKSKTGKAISAWIADKTIAEAKSLLQHSTTSIKEITFLLGFTEATHFSNYFKKHTDLSPAAYRRQYQNS